MHINHCSKCGEAFETKNPKRIVCPNCLYLDRADAPSVAPIRPSAPQQPYPNQPQQGYGPPQQQGGYGGGYPQQQQPQGQGYPQQRPPQQGGYGRPPQQGYGPPRPQGQGYPQQRPPQQGGFGRPPQQGGFPPRPPGNFQPQRPRMGGPGGPRGFGGPPRRGGPGGGRRPMGPPKQLLVSREMLVKIEERYKTMLPLPNPDAHVIIGNELGLEPNKVFFGINLVRQKLKLPKAEYPKRPLAVTPDQLQAVESLYVPFLPVPPIGIHKILSKQLRMDEWRVHVAIGLIRKQQGMNRWNEDRDDLPPDMKKQLAETQATKPAEETPKAEEKPAKAPAKPKKPAAKKAAAAEPTDETA